MLDIQFVKKVVFSELDPRIKAAREMNDKLLLHVDGVGLQESLARVNNYENKLQFEAREKYAISNKFVTEELLRPVDNAFQARGGSRNYKFKSGEKEDALISKLVNIKSNLSLSEYIEQEWFHRFVTDPNGLIFMEVVIEEIKENGEPNKKLEPTYKSIQEIKAYKQNGLYVDWVIFEPHEVMPNIKYPTDNKKLIKKFWAVDENYYYLYELKENELTLLDAVENSFEEVPAILCSNINDPITGWKRSPIDAQVELLDRYLLSNSQLTIVESQQIYPGEWEYAPECLRCGGTGTLDNGDNCELCNGKGMASKRDVTDKTILRIPREGETKIDPPRGYTYLPTEPWELMISSIDRYFDLVINSHYGATKEKKDNETATGRWIDTQPVNNRLSKYSKSIEKAHTALANYIGKYYFPETFERAIIQYGRRYLIETPDQIWGKYLNAKKDNAPTSTLDLLLFQYYESEFRENEQLFLYESKKAKLEPFVHWDISTVKNLNVDQVDYYKKLYFSDWIHSIDVRYVIETDIKKLNEELTTFASDKIPQVVDASLEPLKINNEKV